MPRITWVPHVLGWVARIHGQSHMAGCTLRLLRRRSWQSRPLRFYPSPSTSCCSWPQARWRRFLAFAPSALPLWWVAFPPLVVAMWLGNPAVWVPLLFSIAGPVGVFAKAYVLVPILLLG